MRNLVIAMMFVITLSSFAREKSSFAQENGSLRKKVLREAGPGWSATRERFEKDGVLNAQWQDGLLMDVSIGRLGDKLLVTDRRQVPFAAPGKGSGTVIKLLESEQGWIRLEKSLLEDSWRRAADEGSESPKAQTRIFLATCWAYSPFALNCVPLKSIFEDERTTVEKFEAVGKDGVFVLEFTMRQGIRSDLPGSYHLGEGLPFFFFPAKCTLRLDSQENWRLLSADYERKGTPRGATYDHLSIDYQKENKFEVKIGQGSSPDESKKINKRYTITLDSKPPHAADFKLDTYPMK